VPTGYTFYLQQDLNGGDISGGCDAASNLPSGSDPDVVKIANICSATTG
jgi:hypothetical protein